MSITIIDLLLFVILLALCLWVLQLKQRVQKLEFDLSSKAPEEKPLTANDLKQLQASLAELVDEIESYTGEQMQRMKTQADALHELSKRVERKVQEFEQPPVIHQPTDSTRMVPITPSQLYSNYNEKDRIMDLHNKGWLAEDIAKELRITKGEVQLILNLA